MPFALLIIGVVLLVAGVRGSQDKLFDLLRGDFTGEANFIYWMTAILVIGAAGYIPRLKPISTGFLALVIVVLFLKKGDPTGAGGGFFTQFTSAIGTTTGATNSAGATNATGATGGAKLTPLEQVNQRVKDLREQFRHTFEMENN